MFLHYLSQGKRRTPNAVNGWNNLSGMWGKKRAKWNELSGMWGKRSWNDMAGGWGKSKLARIFYLYSRTLSPSEKKQLQLIDGNCRHVKQLTSNNNII